MPRRSGNLRYCTQRFEFIHLRHIINSVVWVHVSAQASFRIHAEMSVPFPGLNPLFQTAIAHAASESQRKKQPRKSGPWFSQVYGFSVCSACDLRLLSWRGVVARLRKDDFSNRAFRSWGRAHCSSQWKALRRRRSRPVARTIKKLRRISSRSQMRPMLLRCLVYRCPRAIERPEESRSEVQRRGVEDKPIIPCMRILTFIPTMLVTRVCHPRRQWPLMAAHFFPTGPLPGTITMAARCRPTHLEWWLILLSIMATPTCPLLLQQWQVLTIPFPGTWVAQTLHARKQNGRPGTGPCPSHQYPLTTWLPCTEGGARNLVARPPQQLL